MGALDSLSTALSGMQAQSLALQNISGNIANSQTTAFKTVDTNFSDLLAAQMQGSSDGVQPTPTESNTKQGTITATTNATDMAISGDGYFSVATPTVGASGQLTFSNATQEYTRRGDFQLDANGHLVNSAGNYLMGTPVDANGNPTSTTPQLLQFDAASPPTDQGALQGVSIGNNGTIGVISASGQQIPLATVPLSSFRGENFLQQNTDGTLSATTLSGAAFTGASGSIVGSSLESSNTDIAGQFTNMIQTQQAYSANTKIMSTVSEMMQTVTNMMV